MRLNIPNITCLIYQSGKVVYISKSSDDAIKSEKKIFKILAKLNPNISFVKRATFSNIVALSDLGCHVSLYDLIFNPALKEYCMFDPEMFPGLFLKIMNPKLTIIIFSNGKIVQTGAKSIKDIEIGFLKAKALIENSVEWENSNEKLGEE